jgi:hypothetical protein
MTNATTFAAANTAPKTRNGDGPRYAASSRVARRRSVWYPLPTAAATKKPLNASAPSSVAPPALPDEAAASEMTARPTATMVKSQAVA